MSRRCSKLVQNWFRQAHSHDPAQVEYDRVNALEKWHRLSCAVIDLLRQEVTPAEAYAICKFCEQIIGDRYGIEKTELVQNATDLTQ